MRSRKKTRRIKKFGINKDLYDKFKSAFVLGIFKGIGVTVGIAILSTLILFIMEVIPINKVPFIGSLIEEMHRIR